MRTRRLSRCGEGERKKKRPLRASAAAIYLPACLPHLTEAKACALEPGASFRSVIYHGASSGKPLMERVSSSPRLINFHSDFIFLFCEQGFSLSPCLTSLLRIRSAVRPAIPPSPACNQVPGRLKAPPHTQGRVLPLHASLSLGLRGLLPFLTVHREETKAPQDCRLWLHRE